MRKNSVSRHFPPRHAVPLRGGDYRRAAASRPGRRSDRCFQPAGHVKPDRISRRHRRRQRLKPFPGQDGVAAADGHDHALNFTVLHPFLQLLHAEQQPVVQQQPGGDSPLAQPLRDPVDQNPLELRHIVEILAVHIDRDAAQLLPGFKHHRPFPAVAQDQARLGQRHQRLVDIGETGVQPLRQFPRRRQHVAGLQAPAADLLLKVEGDRFAQARGIGFADLFDHNNYRLRLTRLTLTIILYHKRHSMSIGCRKIFRISGGGGCRSIFAGSRRRDDYSSSSAAPVKGARLRKQSSCRATSAVTPPGRNAAAIRVSPFSGMRSVSGESAKVCTTASV